MFKRFLFWRRPAGSTGPVPPAAKPTPINHEMEDNVVVLWSQRWLIDFIDAFLMRWCQFSLMIGCILGTFGLYATSFNLTAQPAFNGVWAGIQAVSIDGLFFAVWSVWRRSAGKGWLRTWYFTIGVLLMVVAAMVNGVVSYTELHKVATIALTMQELHINETVFSWSRSVLVVLVAVLITTLPRGAKIEQPVPIEQTQIVETEPIEPVPAVDIEKVLQTMVAMNQQTIQSVQEMNRQALNVSIEHFTNITVEAVREAVASLPIGSSLPQIEAPEGLPEPLVKLDETEDLEADEKPTYRSETYGDKIEALLQEQPDLNGKQIAELVGCSERTAYKWRNRIIIPE